MRLLPTILVVACLLTACTTVQQDTASDIPKETQLTTPYLSADALRECLQSREFYEDLEEQEFLKIFPTLVKEPTFKYLSMDWKCPLSDGRMVKKVAYKMNWDDHTVFILWSRDGTVEKTLDIPCDYYDDSGGATIDGYDGTQILMNCHTSNRGFAKFEYRLIDVADMSDQLVFFERYSIWGNERALEESTKIDKRDLLPETLRLVAKSWLEKVEESKKKN